jgi:transcriptional regulator with XRE-family HTH domain
MVIGRQARAIRLRRGLRQADVAGQAQVSRSAVSLLERGQLGRLSVASVERMLAALGARFDPRISWSGTDLDRLLDAGHAALAAAIKDRLTGWGWIVRAEMSFNHYGERGRIDLLAWHPATAIVLVMELKTDLVDVQHLLGSMDVKARIAGRLWPDRRVAAVVPAIVFLEDRTTRRRVERLLTLFSRYAVRGRSAITWLRRPAMPAPDGLLWFASLPNARVVRISGQRVRIRRFATRV